MGSIAEMFGSLSNDGSLEGMTGTGSSGTTITDQIAEAIGKMVTTVLKSVLKDMS